MHRPIVDSAKSGGAPIPRAAVKSLVMWSGGLDSTYTLVRLLRETDDAVFAHHVHYNVRRPTGAGRSCRCEYEAGAVSRLLPTIRAEYRNFEYGESRLDITTFSQFARDETTVMYFAAQAALSYGLTPFDRILLGVNASDDVEWRTGTHACALRRLLAAQVLRAVWECDQVPFIYLWDPRPSKQIEAEYLPRELFEMTVSCRDPIARERGFSDVQLTPCESCERCRTRAEVQFAESLVGVADKVRSVPQQDIQSARTPVDVTG